MYEFLTHIHKEVKLGNNGYINYNVIIQYYERENKLTKMTKSRCKFAWSYINSAFANL